MNSGTKTFSKPLGGFDRRSGHLGEIDRNKNVLDIGPFHVHKLQQTASSDSAPLVKSSAFFARNIGIFTALFFLARNICSENDNRG
jgi:hypothetical protein